MRRDFVPDRGKSGTCFTSLPLYLQLEYKKQGPPELLVPALCLGAGIEVMGLTGQIVFGIANSGFVASIGGFPL